jgi:adenylate cyclase class 2
MSSGAREIEVKLAVRSARSARHLLRGAGFRVSRPRVFESNIVFDTADFALRQTGCLLRVRDAGGTSTVTYKGTARPGPHKSREEIEAEVADGGTLAGIFGKIGLLPVFRYEKYRTEFEQSRGGGVAMLDETPIGVFLELEGPPRWIDRTARRLGFSRADYITASYGRLYSLWAEECGEHPSHMVFSGRRQRR